jgi:hypothetical protein
MKEVLDIPRKVTTMKIIHFTWLSHLYYIVRQPHTVYRFMRLPVASCSLKNERRLDVAK